MEQLHNGFTISFGDHAFPLSTDSVLLSGFTRIGRNAKILDLGSGCGTLGLLLCAQDPACRVTGVELNPDAHTAALTNIQSNALQSRLESICADLRSIPQLFPSGSFSICVSNPPYFSGGPASSAHPLARRDDSCGMDELFRSAAWALKYGGDFYLVHRPERLAEICACAAGFQLEPKRLQLVHHKPGDPINLILMQCRKGAKPGLRIEEVCLFESDGSPTPFYRNLYHL